MLAHPATPGVYVQPFDADRGEVQALRTDVCGFVGIAERGPVGVAVAIETTRQFESIFGSYIGAGYLAYAVRGFFENGGRRCRVVRAAAPEAAAAGARIRLGDGSIGLTLAASSPGVWANQIAVAIAPARRAETMALPGGGALATPVVATHGFERLDFVRLSQGATIVFRIVAAVDPAAGLLFWVNPDPRWRQPWEQPLAGLDPNQPLRIERLDYDISVRERGELVAVYSRLSVVPGADRYMPDLLRVRAPFDGRRPSDEALSRLPAAPPPIVATLDDGAAPGWAGVPIIADGGSIVRLSGGGDGLVTLSADDFIGRMPPASAAEPERIASLRGLAAIECAQDVAILAVPDINIQPQATLYDPRPLPPVDPCEPCPLPVLPAAAPPPTPGELPPLFDENAVYRVQAAMIDQCERLRDRFALIDPPYRATRDARVGIGPVTGWRSRFDTAFGALYYPWVTVPDPRGRALLRAIPASGHVAGQLAGTDLSVGVHRAAAAAPLAWAQSATVDIGVALHGVLNDAGVNVITVRTGRLLRILGARTMASDLAWRFVPTRRLVSMLRKALDVSTQWAVFEPNNEATRLSVADGITAFLTQLWRRGALAGAVPEAAFQVRCDEVNNDAERRANGELHVDIAIAPSAPFEFIILRIGRHGHSFELIEDGRVTRSAVGGA